MLTRSIGNGLNLGTSTTIFLSSICLWIFLSRDNKRRAKVNVDEALAGKSQKQIEDLDWRHPAFRWRY